MAKNSLVTKVKGSVQNDNLPLFGKIVIRALEDTTFDPRLPNNTLMEFRGTTYTVSEDRKTIIVENKYVITVVYCTALTNWTFNFDDYKYSPLTEITTRCQYVGSPQVLPSTITYLMLRCLSNDDIFNIEDFGHITSLTTIDTAPSNEFNLQGSIESFVAKARENGRSTGTVTIGRATGIATVCNITYQGEQITTGVSVSWDASTITITPLT